MKIKTITFCLLTFAVTALLAAGVSAQAGDAAPPKSTSKINVKYDKGKDLTVISLKSMSITRLDQEKKSASDRDLPLHQMDVEGNFSYTGTALKATMKEMQLRFHAVAGNYTFLKPQEIIVALDRDIQDKGRAFSLGMSGYRSEPPKFNTVYEEFFVVGLPVDALRKIAAAGSLEFFVGPVSYKLTPKQLDAIKEWEKFLPKEFN